jgi:hypothetical protein
LKFYSQSIGAHEIASVINAYMFEPQTAELLSICIYSKDEREMSSARWQNGYFYQLETICHISSIDIASWVEETAELFPQRWDYQGLPSPILCLQ